MTHLTYLEFCEIIEKYMKVTGFAAFSVKGEIIFVTSTDLIIFVISLAIGVYMCLLSWTSIDMNANKSAIISYGNILTINCAIVIALISMVMFFVLRQELWNVVVKCSSIDEKVCVDS